MNNRTAVRACLTFTLALATSLSAVEAFAQQTRSRPRPPELDTPETLEKVDGLIDEVLEAEATIYVDPRKSKLIRLKQRVSRFSVTDPGVVEIVQYSPTEYELIGGRSGQTTMTLWFEDGQVLRYFVRVSRDDRDDVEYGDLQDRINELFPNSMIQLIPFADKLIVRGQARDAEEASQILSILGGNQVDQGNGLLGPGSFINLGTAIQPYADADDQAANNIISLLDVPGEQQIMLKVRVAEISRAAARDVGMTLIVNRGEFNLTSLFAGGGSPFSAILNTDEVILTLEALSANGYSKILAEPNLVTLNGRPANFISGGQFAVPTVVGVSGVGAVSTSFQGFGTQLSFTPTIIDKDRIRLFVAPSVSSVNPSLSVGGVPGLNSRGANTTVDLREGQWLAIAGLIQDEQRGGKVRAPYLGDIPIFGSLFGTRSIARDETELVILVSPEIVHPMESKELIPLVLPGMEVTEPTDAGFYFWGRYEGLPLRDHRSTVWPIQRDWIATAKHRAMIAAKRHVNFVESVDTYISGPSGFSE